MGPVGMDPFSQMFNPTNNVYNPTMQGVAASQMGSFFMNMLLPYILMNYYMPMMSMSPMRNPYGQQNQGNPYYPSM